MGRFGDNFGVERGACGITCRYLGNMHMNLRQGNFDSNWFARTTLQNCSPSLVMSDACGFFSVSHTQGLLSHAYADQKAVTDRITRRKLNKVCVAPLG